MTGGGGVDVRAFAKLFECGNVQVLVTRDRGDECDHVVTVRFKTNTSGHDVKVAYEFDDAEAQDKAFDDIDEAFAFQIRQQAKGIDL